ncbi:MAG: hypothetical protein GY788_11295, partial [bacterium]|nr:hypothetical protein [bacterium]
KNNKKIYFSAGGKKTAKNKSGTILHEATHHMMNLIFGNQESDNPSAPFSCDKEGGDKKKEFMGIVNTVQEKVKKMKEKEKDKNKCPILESICKAFEYEDILWAGELIVKVPEIIAEFGEEWLENNVPELIAYWKNEIVPKLNDFKPDK